MAEPNKKQQHPEIEPDIRPQLHVVNGGGESTPERGNLREADSPAQDLSDQERKFGVIEGGGESTPERGNLQAVDDVRTKEEAGWQNNYTGGQGEKKQAATFKGLLKKRGPIAIIIGLLGGGGIFAALLSPAALLTTFKETLLNKYNDQLAAMDTRTVTYIKKKFGNTTEGICTSKISLRCRYNTMSDRQIRRLEAAGMKVNTGRSTVTGRNKIQSLEFDGRTIDADAFANELRTNAAFRGAMMRGYNPKLAGFADATFSKLARKLGINKQANVTGDTDEERRKAVIDAANGRAAAEAATGVRSTEEDCTEGDDCKDGKRTTYVDERGNPIDQAEYDRRLSEASGLSDEFAARRALNEAGESVAKGTLKGALTSTALGMGAVDSACTAYVLIRTVGAAAQYVGALQLIRYVHVFFNEESRMRANDAGPEDMEYVGKILTSTNAVGQSATDSYGFRYAAYGDYQGMPRAENVQAESADENGNNVVLSDEEKQKVELSDETTKYISGQLVSDNLLTKIIGFIEGAPGGSTEALDDFCGFVKSGWGQTILIAGALVGAVVAFFSGGASLGWGVGAQVAVSASISVAMAMLTPKLVDMASGTMIGDAELKNGNRTGNAATSGAESYNHQTAQARALPALQKEDAVAYAQKTAEVQAQYAAVDRLHYSPLDASNPNTFMGTLVGKLVPYTSKMSSLSGGVTSMIQFNMSSLASLMPKTSAQNPTAEYEVCQDRDYQSMNLAVGPFCGPRHGMREDVLTRDPDVALAYMENHDYVEKDTTDGQPKDGDNEYAKYIENCVDRSVALGGFTEDNPNKGEECVQGSASKTPSRDNDCATGSDADREECKRDMFRVFYLTNTIEDGTENGYPAGSGGGNGTGSQVSTAAPEKCKTMAADDLGQIACKAYQFDNYGYKWGGGHAGTAKGFMEDFKDGKYQEGKDSILDCSGLVRMAIFDATGVDIGGMATTGYTSYSKFKEVSKEDAKPGDILWTSVHTEIVVSNDAAAKKWQIVGAHNSNVAFDKQIGPTSAAYSKYDKVFRFQK